MSQLERLARPFPARYVKPPPQGKYGSYVPHDVVTQAALAILGPFDLAVGEILHGPDGEIEGCLVTLTVTIDGRVTSVTEVGDCENPSNWKTQGARMKDAISDGLKRCAMRIGLGLHLWAQEDYFLYRQLQGVPPREVSGSSPMPEEGEPSPVPTRESAGDGDPEVSANRKRRVQEANAHLAAAGVPVSKLRAEAGLPLVDKRLTVADLERWEQFVAEQKAKLEAVRLEEVS